MRLLTRLRCIESGRYEMQYHYHLQGFIYNLLRGSEYDQIHNKVGYKFFCFSNIFPAKDLRDDEVRTLLISSPDAGFINYLCKTLQSWSSKGREVKVGAMKFKVDSARRKIDSIGIALDFAQLLYFRLYFAKDTCRALAL